MRMFLCAIGALAALTSVSFAEQTPRPTDLAPTASAPFEVRESWCIRYVEWYTPQVLREGDEPAESRNTRAVENELTYCKTNPQTYEQETAAELARLSPS